MHRHDADFPWEVQTGSRRVMLQSDLSTEVYRNLVMDDLEDLSCLQLRALEKKNIEANKPRVTKYYNKRLRLSNSLKETWFGK